jgi:hypothetical protein
VLLNIAGDSERYEEARDHLRCVVKMRPDFSAAYEALATAETRAGSVEIRSSYLSLPKRENVEAIAAAKRAALEKFHEKGFKRPPKLLMTYAFVNLLDALRRRDTSALKVSVQAREVIRRARALLIAKALRTSVDAARQALRSAQDAGGTYRSSLSWFQFNWLFCNFCG